MLLRPKRYHNLFDPGADVRAFGGSLSNEFIVPPFSVLDAASSAWQRRRRMWGKLDLLKVNGRELDMTYHTQVILKKLMGTESESGNTSRFDPVLCEILYTWFCKKDGCVLDPFAGGCVRGVIAGFLGLDYCGVDLSKRQVDDNCERAKKYDMPMQPEWVAGDSRFLPELLPKDDRFDFVMSCPPYFDYEKYTDNPADLSNALGWDDFKASYYNIIKHSVDRLRNNRFAAFVVSDIRDPDGGYRGLPALTADCFRVAGMSLVNDIVLLDPLGSAVLRARRNFIAGKVSRVHQNVLVFVKGDARKAFAQTTVGQTMVREMAKEKAA